MGIILLVFSDNVQEYSFNYTRCIKTAPSTFAAAPSDLGNVPFEWKSVKSLPEHYSKYFPDEFFDSSSQNNFCELRFTVKKPINGPVFLYYGLNNFYQNQRLYMKSVDWGQLRGEARSYDQLGDCSPLVAPSDGAIDKETGKKIVYYPCGLIANSMFNDSISGLVTFSTEGGLTQPPPEPVIVNFPPKDITWPYESSKYGVSNYTVNEVLPPPFWRHNSKYVDAKGHYIKLPNLAKDFRFQNWMKVAGLPHFRKLYGRHDGDVEATTYTLLINSAYEVESYGATKSVIISNTSWFGGKNDFLGYAFVANGGIFLLFGIVFLIRHLMAPRKLGDTSLLSWNQASKPPNFHS